MIGYHTEVATEAMPTQSVSTEVGTARGGEGAKVEVSHELSRAESVESIRSERSFTEESETKSVHSIHNISIFIILFLTVVSEELRKHERQERRHSQCLLISLSNYL